MSLPVVFHPELPAFDIHRALTWIQGEADWIGLRFVQEQTYRRTVRNHLPEDNAISLERGVMVEALIEGHIAYAGTSDLSQQGVIQAARRAAHLARTCARHALFPFTEKHRPPVKGYFTGSQRTGFDRLTLAELTDQLIRASQSLKVSDKIVSTVAEVTLVDSTMLYVSSSGADIEQQWWLVSCHCAATAQDGTETQQRSLNGPAARCRQAGLEFFDFPTLHAECGRAVRHSSCWMPKIVPMRRWI